MADVPQKPDQGNTPKTRDNSTPEAQEGNLADAGEQGNAPKRGGKPGGAKKAMGAGPGGLRKQVVRQEAEIATLKEELSAARVGSTVSSAHMRPRHWGLILSFLLLVVAPIAITAYYLFAVAKDQYASQAGFTVRTQETTSASDLLGGLANFAGGSAASDSDILYEYISSQEMVVAVNRHVDLVKHYSSVWEEDRIFGLRPDARLEDLVDYWSRVVDISYDSNSGLIEILVRAFDPVTAHDVARAIVEESQIRINALNEQARADAMSYAEVDLDEALTQLKEARQALTEFRTRTRIVDPQADIQSRLGVMTNLQQQLAEALIEFDILQGTTIDSDPRLNKAERTIEVIRKRIEQERQDFASDDSSDGGSGQDYPQLFAEYERLTVDLEYSEEAYRSALASLEAAKDNFSRQSRYLATYINPTTADTSTYPQRYIITAVVAAFLILIWAVLALIYYSVRDRR